MPKPLLEIAKLPMTTAECDEGPVIESRPGRLAVRYDVEGEAGSVWTTVRFHGVAAHRFTSDSGVAQWMIAAYSRVCEVPESEWVEALCEQASSAREQMRSVRHYVVYFDDHGCLEVAAESFVIEAAR